MKEKLFIGFKYCWQIGSFCMFWWLVFLIGREIFRHFRGPTKQEIEEEQSYNPRTWIPNSEFDFKDSIYYVTVQIDSVYYNPEPPEPVDKY